MTSRVVLVLSAGVAVILLLIGLYQCEPKSEGVDTPGVDPTIPEATVEPSNPAPEPAPEPPPPPRDPEPGDPGTGDPEPEAPVVDVLPDTGGRLA